MNVLLSGAAGQQGSPYRPEQARDPLGAYGRTKAAGEEGNSWVIGPVGKNFSLTMLRLHREKPAISVVSNQVGCPTSTATLAAACWRVIMAEVQEPVLHWCDAGAASWFDVAVAVGELALELGLLQQPAPVNPLTTAEYPLPAQRPSYSLLDCSSSRQALRQLLEALA